MEVIGIRFCAVSKEAEKLAEFLGDGIGLPKRDVGGEESKEFNGAIFPAGTSWIEVWPESEQLPEGIMLQIEVDNADEFAEHARKSGLEPHGPFEAYGEKVYYLHAPTGLPVTFQSRMQLKTE